MRDIDPDLPIPLYYQLKTLVLEEIASGKYPPGEQLPTEHELCARYGISRTPTHRALSELADEGVILRMRRRGTFVNPHWAPRRSTQRELRVMVSDSVRASQIREAVPGDAAVNVATVEYDDLHRTLTTAVAEGRAPDMALIDEVWIADFADSGFLVALDDLDPDWVSREYETDFAAAFEDGRRFGGKVYAVPEEINVAGLWCRRDLLVAAAAGVPSTWDEFRLLARQLQPLLPTGTHAFAMPGGHVAAETTSYCLLAVLASNGISVIDGGVLRLDSGAAASALRLLRSLIEEGTMSVDVVTYDWLRSPRLLGSGRAAMTLGGTYEAEVIAAAAGLDLADVWEHFVFAPFPGGPQGAPATIAGGMAYGIFRQSQDPHRTFELLKRLVDTEGLAERAQGRPTIPPRQSAADLIAADSPLVAEAARLYSTAFTRPTIPDYHLVSTQLQNMLEMVLTGRIGPAAAAERTAEIIAAITGLPVVHD
jgi:multiple sugar transport system substrate-binding protein